MKIWVYFKWKQQSRGAIPELSGPFSLVIHPKNQTNMNTSHRNNVAPMLSQMDKKEYPSQLVYITNQKDFFFQLMEKNPFASIK